MDFHIFFSFNIAGKRVNVKREVKNVPKIAIYPILFSPGKWDKTKDPKPAIVVSEENKTAVPVLKILLKSFSEI